MIRAVLKGRNPATKRKPHQHTVMEGFIDDYGRLRLIIALASLVLLAGLALAGQRTLLVGANALGLSVMAVHAAWNLASGVRNPRLALALDITVISSAALVSVPQATAGLSLAFWCILITFLTYGRSRQVLYAYGALWYLFLINRATPPQDVVITISVMFTVGTVVLILLMVSRRMLMLELQRSQLLGSVSHELRNQLTGVIGMTDLALDQNAAPTLEEVRDLIGLARREAVDAAGIVEDLLTATSMESNVLDVAAEPVDVDLEVAKIVDHYPTEGMFIQHTGPQSGVLALADQVRLRQVLRNLLSNAVRYGGTMIVISVHPQGSIVHIRVADDGPGVPPGEEETIFLPYRRSAKARRHRNSVGLGLWTSRRLAKAMGGDLKYGRADEQTVFELTLPIYTPAPEPGPLPAQVTDAP